MYSTNPIADNYDANEGTNGQTNDGNTILIQASYNTTLKDISVKNSLSHGIQINNSISTHGLDINIDGAYNKDGSSHGYGLYFVNAWANNFSDVEIKNTRHSAIFSTEHAEFYNKIDITYTNRDVNFHGGPDYHNIVNVNEMNMDSNTIWSAEEYFRPAGNHGQPSQSREAYEARNTVTFKTLQGGGQIDNVRADASGGVLKGGYGNDYLYGAGGVDRLMGEADNDRIYAESGDDYLDGGIGNDTLDGGVGNDTMVGGAGDDLLIVDAVGDIVTEALNEGVDSVHSYVTFSLSGRNIENLNLLGGNAINGTGNSAANVITGNTANNLLIGGAGADTIYGGDGDDTIDGGSDSDALYGRAGNDLYVLGTAYGDNIFENAGEGTDTVQSQVSHTLTANVENLVFTGTGSYTGTGNNLNNSLTGNSGKNIFEFILNYLVPI